MAPLSNPTPEQVIKREIFWKKSYLAVLLVLPTLIGGIVGYAARAIETAAAMNSQEARHVAEIMRIRDEYGERAKDTRVSVKAAADSTALAAEATREATRQLKEIAQELGPENTRAARRAKEANEKAQEARAKAEEAARVAKESELRVGRIMSPVEHRREEPRKQKSPPWLDGP